MDTPEGPRKRCRRFNIVGDAHELTFSCYRGRPFLAKDRTCRFPADAIIKAREKHLFDVWAYVFMPNHVHLLIWPPDGAYSVSRILQSIKQSVSRRALRYLRKRRPQGLRHLATGQVHRPYRFWQDGGGHDRNIMSEQALLACVEYIHNNPVRKELVSYPEDWTWSSASEWAGRGPGPVSIDRNSFPSL